MDSSDYYKSALMAAQQNYNDSILALAGKRKKLSDDVANSAQNVYSNYLKNLSSLGDSATGTSDVRLRSSLGQDALHAAQDEANSGIDVRASQAKARNAADTAALNEARDNFKNQEKETLEALGKKEKTAAQNAAADLIKNGVVNDALLRDAGIDEAAARAMGRDDKGFAANLVDSISGAGYVPSDAELERAGLTRAQADKLKSDYDEAMREKEEAAKAAKTSGRSSSRSSSSSSSSSSSGSGKLTYGEMKKMIQDSYCPRDTFKELLPYMSMTASDKLEKFAEKREQTIRSGILSKPSKPMTTALEMRVHDEIVENPTIEGIVEACKKMQNSHEKVANILRILIRASVINAGKANAAAHELGITLWNGREETD